MYIRRRLSPRVSQGLTYFKQSAQAEAHMKTEFDHVCRGKRTPVHQERLDAEGHESKEESVEENPTKVGPVRMYHRAQLRLLNAGAATSLNCCFSPLFLSVEIPEPSSQRVGAVQ